MKRRSFLKAIGMTSLAGSSLLARPQNARRRKAAETRGSAENVIIVNLQGAPSHVDTFDLKVGSWTPADFDPTTVGNITMAAGLFPNLIGQADKFSLLRSITGNEAVHSRAQYIVETAQTFNPTFSQEQPHIGSVLAYELEASRKDTDIMPTFLAFNANVQPSGLLPSTYAAFTIAAENGVSGLEHPGGENLFNRRWDALNALDLDRSTTAAQGAIISDYHNFYALGKQMMYEPVVEAAFTLSEDRVTRYGDNETGRALAMAVQAIEAQRGTRVIQVTQGGWDHHYDIYDRDVAGNLYEVCSPLDQALAATLEDLAGKPGVRGGTLLDETLVVVLGEFGRTPGATTNNLGRDHYQYVWSGLFAGGGIIPGQAFGSTDAEGYGVNDPFWSEDHTITLKDIAATIYSSLGIDWTKEIADTPSGRVYEYTPKENGVAGYYRDIVGMFSS